VGFVITTFIFLVAWMWVIERLRWWTIISISVGTTVGLYSAALLFMLIFFLWPLGTMVVASVQGPYGLSLSYYADFLGRRLLLRSFWNSLAMAGISTVSATIVGRLKSSTVRPSVNWC
jgi:ABC-type spermidine/putrescine transport system permease subunit II